MALSANTSHQTRDQHLMTKGKAPNKASVTIYAGAMVCIDPATGRAEPASDTAGLIFAGFATKQYPSATADTQTVEFEFGHRVRIPKGAGITNADIGAQACIVDDETVTDAGAATNDVKVGIIESIDGSFAWVLTKQASL